MTDYLVGELGRTVLLATHVLSEAEELCDRVALVKAGRVVALGPVEEPIVLPPFFHFGRGAASPDDVRAFRDRVEADGLEIVDWWDEPDYVSVKFRDPDGYVIEVGWEPE